MQRPGRQEGVTRFVVGLPVLADGRESRVSREARQFGAWLGEATGVPVEFFDERFTTAEAHGILTAAELRGRRRKQRLDMLAAQILLEAYLEAAQQGQSSPGALDD